MAQKQTQGEFKSGVVGLVTETRPELSKADINAVLDAVVEVAQGSLADGYEVPLLGLVKLVPTVKTGRKKGTEVRNPFDGTTRKLTANEPDTVKVKARPMAAAKNALPSAGSALKSLINKL